VAIAVECPHCGKQLRVKDELAGRKGKCPQCSQTIQIPATVGAAVAAGAAVKQPAKSVPGKNVSEPRETATSDTAAVSTAAATTQTAPAAVATPAKPAAPAKPAPQTYEQIRETVLAGFSGQLTPPKVSIVRKLGSLLVLLVLLLMPVFYAAVVGAVGYCLYLLVTSNTIPFTTMAWPHPAAQYGAEAAAALFLIGLIKPLIEPQRRGEKVYPIDAANEPLLCELTTKICEQVGMKPPKTIQFECSTHFAATKSGRVLTLGLPAAASLSAEQLAAVMLNLLAHCRPGSGAKIMNAIRGVNYWLWRSVYGQGRFDRWLALVAQRRHLHFAKLLLPLVLMRLPAQLVLFIPMFIANTLAQSVVRAAEFDADKAAARLVGKKMFGIVIERLEHIDFVWTGLPADLKFLHKEGQLPPNLPQEVSVRMQDMTAELVAALRDTVNAPEEKPFDTRPSTSDRLQALNDEPAEGVFRCGVPARNLLRDYEGLARQISADFYAARFGAKKEGSE
jgi:predicted Zn finger-like uncharacterized protein